MDVKRMGLAELEDVATLSAPPGTVLVNSLVKKVQPYYRSKAFVSQIGINPLIAAAAPVFFLIEKFQHADTTPDLDALHDDLSHEVKAFENHAQSHGYKSQVVLAARYILCLWIDEMILNTHWGENNGWDKLLMAWSENKHGASEKSFFSLLEHCLQDTSAYIDLLELFYLCLSLGYEGEYKHAERGHILLSELRDHLYHRIHHQRGEISKQLEATSPQEKIRLPRRSTLSTFMTTCTVILSIAVIGGYFLMNHELTKIFTAVVRNIQ